MGNMKISRAFIVTLIVLIPVAWFFLSIVFMWFPVCREYPHAINSCLGNLRMIHGAKEQWALANGKKAGDPIVISEVNQYIKGNTTPSCPSGGTYSYNALGIAPRCSKEGTPRRKKRVTLFSWEWDPLGGPHEIDKHLTTERIAEP